MKTTEKSLARLTNTNELILIDENEMEAGSPYYTEYYKCEDSEEMESILSGKEEEPNWERLSESYYRDGDVLLSNAVDNLRKANEKLILIKDENGIERLNNCEWNWERFYVSHDGNNYRAIQFEIEEDNINFERIAELEAGKTFIDLVKINDKYYIAAQGNYGDSTTYIYPCEIISEDELTAEIAGEHTTIIKTGYIWEIKRDRH